MNNSNTVDYEYLSRENLERARLQYARYFTRHKKAKKVDGQVKCDILADEGKQHGNAKDFIKFKRAKLAAQKDNNE